MLRVMGRVALAGAMLWVTAAAASAQQTTTAETKTFEVIAVDGNDLVVKLPEGTRELTVPEGFRFTVDGQQVSVQELKPGMKGTATITTKTTMRPVTVTEVKKGTVKQVTGSTITVQTEQGFRMFTQGDVDKRGVKIVRDGRPAQLSELRAGDQLSATIITTKPPVVMTERQVQATLARSEGKAEGAAPAGAAPAAAPAPSAGAPATAPAPSKPAASSAPQPAATAGEPAPARKLPKTASSVPLLGVAGVVSLALGLALTIRRRRMIG